MTARWDLSPNRREDLRRRGLDLGFCRVGFTTADPLERGAHALERWLTRGMHGAMTYMAHLTRRAEPHALLPSARSAIVAALAYCAPPADDDVLPAGFRGDPPGHIARYARGADYHGVMRRKLSALAEAVETVVGRPAQTRLCVDTAPLLERELAMRAGIGFIGKSTMCITPGVGSFTVLGVLLVDTAIGPDTPAAARCGDCRRCLDVCPTGALKTPYELDARRCIAYLTIEQRESVASRWRSRLGTMVFGCDLCQQVCPFNATRHRPPTVAELAPRPTLRAPGLLSLLTLGSASYRRLVAGSALRRVSRHQLARNAAIALGNVARRGDGRIEGALAAAVRDAPRAEVRQHAAWALGQRGGGNAARTALGRAARDDESSRVREEATTALGRLEQVTALARREP